MIEEFYVASISCPEAKLHLKLATSKRTQLKPDFPNQAHNTLSTPRISALHLFLLRVSESGHLFAGYERRAVGRLGANEACRTVADRRDDTAVRVYLWEINTMI